MTQQAIEGLEAAQLEEIERRAVEFARKAGEILLGHFRQPLQIEYKSEGRRDPVTQADRESEDWLRSAISEAFPDHGIVGEENPNSEHGSADFVWVLDPLDGTTNFLNGLPVFASSIGVLYRGRPAVAAIFVPGPDGGSVVHARRGGGAFQGRPPHRRCSKHGARARTANRHALLLLAHVGIQGRSTHEARRDSVARLDRI